MVSSPRRPALPGLALSFLLLGLLVACRQEAPPLATPVLPTATAVPLPTAETELPAFEADADALTFITVATDAPFPPFATINEFGTIVGFDADIMANIAVQAGLDFEFVVTSHDGLVQSVADGDFDVAMSGLIIPDEPPPGIAYTQPYLEVGQVLVVRANERTLLSFRDIQPGTRIGVQSFSSGQQTAETVLGLPANDLLLFDTPAQAVQALIDNSVDGVIIDSDDAQHFASTYFQQLRLAGGEGREAWISSTAYGLAVAAGNEALLEQLNKAIAQLYDDGTVDRLTLAWLVPDESINAGESLIGTPANELVIGISGELDSLDPAAPPDLIRWELNSNTMSGLYMVGPDNELQPLLFSDVFLSDDRKEYTFRLREGMVFPDGSALNGEDVRWSVLRSARQGNWLVNAFLKDADEDGFADDDAVEVVGDLSVKFALRQPTSYFPYLLATPPYFLISDECYAPTADPASTCGGLGPYTIQEWVPGEKMQLKANPQWPGPTPAFENIQLRFYASPEAMRASLARGSIDLAWTGLQASDLVELQDSPDFRTWPGPAAFTSSLVFVHDAAPWDDARVRQAAALAVDRDALAQQVFAGTRLPLYSPVPDDIPGHVAAEPVRDLEQAGALLAQAGYSPDKPLPVTLAYVSDGRYSPVEGVYAEALKSQWEETGIFQVTLQGAPWDVFRNEKSACNYPAFLQGWPSPGQPVPYLDAMSWLYFFVDDTDTLCSNYQSPQMEALIKALEEADPADATGRLDLYGQIQQLWAEDMTTLALTQTPRAAIALLGVRNVQIDGMGLLHYQALTKGGG